MKIRKLFVLFLWIPVSCMNFANAACNVFWANAASGDWHTGSNWSTGLVPDSNSEVCITQPGIYTVTLSSSDAFVKNLTLGGISGTQTLLLQKTLGLTQASTVNITGVLQVEKVINGPGSLTIAGSLVKNGGDAISTVSVPVHLQGIMQLNSGTFRFSGGGSIASAIDIGNSDAVFELRGEFDLLAGASFHGQGTILLTSGAFDTYVDTIVADSLILDLQGGSIKGSADLIAEGTVFWDSGSCSLLGPGALVNAESGSLTIQAASFGGINGGVLRNEGTMMMQAGRMDIYNGGLLENTTGSLFTLAAGATIFEYLLGATIINEGTILMETASGIATIDGVAIENQGTIQVTDGTLRLSGGENDGGNFSAMGDGILEFYKNTYLLKDKTQFSGTGQFSVNGGILNIEGVVTSAVESFFEFDFGSVKGPGTLNIQGDAFWDPDGCPFKEQGITQFRQNLTIDPFSSDGLDARTVENYGTAVLLAGRFDFYNGALFHNMPGAMFEMKGGSSLFEYLGTGTFWNEGTFLMNDPNTTAHSNDILFDNDGIVEVQSGILKIDGGASSGRFIGSTPGVLEFSVAPDLHVLNDGASFEGDSVKISGGYLSVAEQAKATLKSGAKAMLQSGKILGQGDFVVEGTLLWNIPGGMEGPGITTVASGGMVEFTPGCCAGIKNRTVENAGTFKFMAGSRFDFSDGAILRNLAGGVMDLENAVEILSYTGSNFFQNLGDIQKKGSSTFKFSGIDIDNRGVLEIAEGTLTCSNCKLLQNAGRTILKGGSLNASVDISGGGFKGNGSIVGNVKNIAGTFGPGLSPGKLTISGSYTQESAGVFEVDLAGYAPETEFDQLSVSGAATLGGTLKIVRAPGFAPILGDTFQITSFSSRSGDFTSNQGMPLPDNLMLEKSYANTTFSLVVGPYIPAVPAFVWLEFCVLTILATVVILKKHRRSVVRTGIVT